MATADTGDIALHVAQQASPLLAHLAVALEHHAPLEEVGGRRDEHALRLQPVAPGATRLLLIVLQRLWRAGMEDESHVGSIDAHAERHRRDDDVDVLVEERVLIVIPRAIVEAGMIRPRAVTVLRSHAA